MLDGKQLLYISYLQPLVVIVLGEILSTEEGSKVTIIKAQIKELVEAAVEPGRGSELSEVREVKSDQKCGSLPMP